jgi:drug/metabolite transporter (DMT)-like permease
MAALLALLSSLMWGTGDFLGGWLSRRIPALAVLGYSQIVGFVIMWAVAFGSGEWRIGWGPYVIWGVLASICGFTGLAAFYTALALGRMGVVSPIAALGVLVPLGAGLLRGETPLPWQYLGIVLAVVGVVLASGPEVTGAAGVKPVLLACVAALAFGLFLVFVAIGSETSAVMTMTAQRTTSTILVVVMALAARSTGGVQVRDAGWLIVIGAFDVLANLLFGIAATMGLLAIVSVLGSLYPVVTVLLAWSVLKERLSPVQYVGVAVALVGVAAISLG